MKPATLLPLLLLLTASSLPLPLPPSRLKNNYIALRHGHAENNLLNVINSDPSKASLFGLTEKGRVQAAAAAGRLDGGGAVVYTSEFKRAGQTAAVVAGSGSVVTVESSLNERSFGSYDGKPTGTYDDIWPRDMSDPTNTEGGVESVYAVITRLAAMLSRMEDLHESRTIILCSHADVLQILTVWLAGLPVGDFSCYRIGNCEERECRLDDGAMGESCCMVSQSEVAA